MEVFGKVPSGQKRSGKCVWGLPVRVGGLPVPVRVGDNLQLVIRGLMKILDQSHFDPAT